MSSGSATRVISVVTLAIQLLGLVHLGVEQHTLSAEGRVIEALPLDAEAHEHPGSHVCEDEGTLGDDGALSGCAVVASWKAAGLLGGAAVARPVPEAAPASFVSALDAPAVEDVLARAPKASPPRAG